jgi:TetR/AcrR family transcriptional regulator, repressor for neighboring sulfatase
LEEVRAMAETRAEEIREALIEALVRLLKTRSIARISVREIAAEAGMNHGLVHRHFGSKDDLVRAAARRLSEELHGGDPVQRGMSASSFAQLRARPELARVVARACLDGPGVVLEQAAPSPERLEELVAPVRRALERLGFGEAVDPYVLNGLATAALLGWFVFKPLLGDGFGLSADADDRVAALLERLDAVLAPYRAPPR